MKLKALFDYGPYRAGDVFEIDAGAAAALMAAQANHFEIMAEVAPEPVVAAVEQPPADKMVKKPKVKK